MATLSTQLEARPAPGHALPLRPSAHSFRISRDPSFIPQEDRDLLRLVDSPRPNRPTLTMTETLRGLRDWRDLPDSSRPDRPTRITEALGQGRDTPRTRASPCPAAVRLKLPKSCL